MPGSKLVSRFQQLSWIFVCSLIASLANAQLVSTWEASSGLTPTQVDAPWTLSLDGGAAEPVLDAGILTIATTVGQNVIYIQSEPMVETARPFTLEFSLKLVSGSTGSQARAPMMLFITIADSTGILLAIDLDRIVFVTSPTTIGATANVDTDDAMHNYRLDHDGAGRFSLYYDGGLILEDNAYTSTSDHGNLQRIGWGEGSGFAYGVVEVFSVQHNALTTIFKDSFEDSPAP